jgi:hypothetical protein
MTANLTPETLTPHVGSAMANLLPTMGIRSLFNLMTGLMAMRHEVGGTLTIHMPTKNQRAEVEWNGGSDKRAPR